MVIFQDGLWLEGQWLLVYRTIEPNGELLHNDFVFSTQILY